MASKYDPYWEERLNKIREILNKAYRYGKSREIDVSGIKRFWKKAKLVW